MSEKPGIRRAQSRAPEAQQAVRELQAAIVQPDMALVAFFCSSDYDLDLLASAMHGAFPGTVVIGCTTAGEIGPAGYLEHSLTGVSFPASDFQARSIRIEALKTFSVTSGLARTQDLVARISAGATRPAPENCFALLLIDGLSIREEPVTRTLQSALGQIPLVGGSAGDGAKLGRTAVYSDGAFHSDSATLTLVTTRLPILPFQTHHFIPTDERLVVTAADPAQRSVKEINGFPAAEAYARILGLGVHDLNPACFAASPVVVVINGVSYVRSIQKATPDGSLTFFCAIDNGLILRVARTGTLVESLEKLLARIRTEIGPPQVILGFDCLLRKVEIFQSPDKERVIELLLQNKTTGFGTYGEQFRGIHVNQTMTGIAIGSRSGSHENA